MTLKEYRRVRKSLDPRDTFCVACGEIFPKWLWSTHTMICWAVEVDTSDTERSSSSDIGSDKP